MDLQVWVVEILVSLPGETMNGYVGRHFSLVSGNLYLKQQQVEKCTEWEKYQTICN